MKDSVIIFKVDRCTKIQAQKLAGKLGLSLSALIIGFLKTLIKTRTVHFENKKRSSKYSIWYSNQVIKEARIENNK